MLRSVLLFLSEQARLRHWMETSPLAGRLTGRFVAGQTLEQELEVCRRLNQQGILVTVDHLGEKVTSLEEARSSRDAYLETLARIAQEKLDASVSIKLSQFGLGLSTEVCRHSAQCLVARATEVGGFVEIDMESHETVDSNLAIVTGLHERFGRVRSVIQAYLYRSAGDIAMLCRNRVPVRLCKGAYQEPPAVAFPRKADVNQNYKRLSEVLLEQGVYPALATHDPEMIDHALAFVERKGIPKEGFEFQMLYGIRRDLQDRLIASGYRLRLYVPYGGAWYPYFMRRLAERPANLLFLARNLLRR
jgi:proline dehydrogenase